MRLRRATLHAIGLPLRRPLGTGAGAIAAREGWLLRLESDAGECGFGEALPLASFGHESLEACGEALRAGVRKLLHARSAPERLGEEPLALADAAPAANAALEGALLDLQARTTGRALAELLGGVARRHVQVSALVAGDSPEQVAAAARTAVAEGFATLKLKVGAADPARDEARVAALRAAVGGDVALRLDANGAWDTARARDALAKWARYGLELVEQPLPADALAELAALRAETDVPLAADESAASEAAAARVIAAGAADLLVVKPAAVGGLGAARRIARRARDAGLPVLVTSALDSLVGRTAALHFAATLPDSAPAAGLVTGPLLADDLGPDDVPQRGVLALPEGPGLGCNPDAAALERLALRAPEVLEP